MYIQYIINKAGEEECCFDELCSLVKQICTRE
jgi:hypothetical protein